MPDGKRGPETSKGTFETYLQALRQSGLMDEGALSKAVDEFRTQAQEPAKPGAKVAAVVQDPPNGSSLGRFLVAKNHITGWQHRMLLEGRFRGFFLGKYRLLRLLGTGGMSQVYLAEHMRMRRRVAIKVLSSKLTSESGALERFMIEARSIAALDHLNIVHAYNVDSDAGIYYLVMQYVEGHDLSRIVEVRGPLPFDKAADYIRQAADGLSHAHDRGLIHRDVKPHNLLVDRTGTVKITDLGLALQTNLDENSLTRAFGQGMLGTTDYLAPEQALDSHNVDARADIYSLGCTLYFLLTGRAPFNEGTLAQRLVKHQTAEPPAIAALRPDAPADLVAICGKMMAKQPANRYQTARAVSATLAEWAATTRRSSTVAASELPEAVLAEGSSQAIDQVSLASGIDQEETSDLLEDSTHNLADEHALPPLPVVTPTPPRRLSVANLRAASANSVASRYSQRQRVMWWQNLAIGSASVIGLSLLAWFAVSQLSAPRPDVVATPESKKAQAWIVLDWPMSERTGASISVDGIPFEAPAEGVLEIPVDAGSRRLTITKPGVAPYERTIVLTEGQRKSIAPWFGAVAPAAPVGDVLLAARPPATLSALDRLDPARLTPAASDLAARAPLVAVWGDLRFAHWTPIRGLTYAPTGAVVAVSQDSQIKLWQPEGQAAWETIPTPAEFVYITALECSPGGKLAALETPLTGKSVVRLRSLATGAVEQTLAIGAQPLAFTFVRDELLATGNAAGVVQLWSTLNGQAGAEIATPLVQVRLLTASTAGDLLAVAGLSPPTPGAPRAIPRIPKVTPKAAPKSDASKPPLSGEADEKKAEDETSNDPAVSGGASKPVIIAKPTQPRAPVLIIDPATKEIVRTLNGHEGQITALRFIPGGAKLASGGLEGTIRIWTADTGELATEIEAAHPGPIFALAADPGGEVVASLGGPDCTLRLWDVATGRKLRETTLISGISQPHLQFSPDGKTLSLTTGQDCRVQSFAVETLAPLTQFAGHTASVMSAAWQPGNRLLTADLRGRVLLWNPAAGAGVPLNSTEPEKPTATLLSPTGELLASVTAGTSDPNLRTSDPATGVVRATIGPGTLILGTPAAWSFSPDGNLLAASWFDATARRFGLNVWNPRTGAPVTTQGAPTSRVSTVAWSPDGRLLAAAAQTGAKHDITLYDTTAWTAKSVLSGHSSLIYSLAFSSDSTRVASASLDGTVRLWKAPEGTQLTQLAHESPAMAVDISPDGAKVATLGRDGQLKIWTASASSLSLASAYPLFPPGSPTQFSFGPTACPVQRLMFAPDGRHLAITCANGVVYVMRLGLR